MVFKNEMRYLYRVERGHVLSFVLCRLAFQCGCFGAVDCKGLLGIVGCNGAVVDQIVGKDVLKVLL